MARNYVSEFAQEKRTALHCYSCTRLLYGGMMLLVSG